LVSPIVIKFNQECQVDFNNLIYLHTKTKKTKPFTNNSLTQKAKTTIKETKVNWSNKKGERSVQKIKSELCCTATTNILESL